VGSFKPQPLKKGTIIEWKNGFFSFFKLEEVVEGINIAKCDSDVWRG